MALTAARTELNVSLTGEDETARMLADANKRVAQLEAQTRDLTNATRAQGQAAQATQSVMESTNSKLKGLAERAEGAVDGVDKVKGAVEKVIGVFGFLGMAIQGAVTGYEFLRDAFDDSAETAEKHKQELEKAKAETDRLKGSTDALRGSIAALAAQLGQGAAAIANQRARLATLRGDVEGAAFETREALIAGEESRLAEFEAKRAENAAQLGPLQEIVAKGVRKVGEESAKAQAEVKRLEDSLKGMKASSVDEAVKMLPEINKVKAQLETARAMAQKAGSTNQAEVDAAEAKLKLLEAQNKQLDTQIENQKEIIELEIEGHATDMLAKPDKPRGGGGGGGGKKVDEDAERKRREDEEKAEAARLKALQEEEEARARILKMMREVAEIERAEVAKSLTDMRAGLEQTLAELPTDPAFDKIREQTEKQMAAVKEQIDIFTALGNLQNDELVIAATDKQVEAVDKLTESYKALGDAKAQAAQESERLREQMERDNIAGKVYSFSEALQGLGDIQAPVFEAVTDSLAGVTAQMQKFQGGQQTLTQAVIGSGAAIAAAVGKQVESVRVEAGIRALFETAMGFANLGNPAVAVGHFTAAAMFGAVAGGLIPATPKTAPGGGQKAPEKTAATKDVMSGGGGGQITNVYNLQTGIVDGQSTARAFRQAEAQARNTGMASAGGW